MVVGSDSAEQRQQRPFFFCSKPRERIWRQALILKKRQDFLNKRKAWMKEMCQRCMEQGLYLATLSVRGERRVKRSVDDLDPRK